MGIFTKSKKKEHDNICVKIRKSVMEETLENLKKLRQELDAKKQNQVA